MVPPAMSLEPTVTFHYDHPPGPVLALLLDPQFLTERSVAMGELDVQVTAQRDGDRVVIVNQRTVRRELPPLARKLFSPVNQLTQTVTWELGADVSVGSSRIEVRGAPLTIDARFELRPDGAGSAYRVTFDIDVRVPVIGGTLARHALEQTRLGAHKDLEYTAARLRRGN